MYKYACSNASANVCSHAYTETSVYAQAKSFTYSYPIFHDHHHNNYGFILSAIDIIAKVKSPFVYTVNDIVTHED